MHFTLVIGTLSFLLGVLFANKSSASTEIAIALLGLTIAQAVIFIWKKSRVARVILLVPLCMLLGIVRVQFVVSPPVYTCAATCEVTGMIVSVPESKDAYQQFDLRVDERDSLLVRVRVPLYPVYEIGETMTLRGKVTEPQVFFPHAGSRVFDYPGFLKNKNIGSEMYYPTVVEVVQKDEGTLGTRLAEMRVDFVKRISRNMGAEGSTLATGMLLGNQNMSKELLDIFRTAGLSHVVVLSGFNIAIIIAAALFILSIAPLFLRIILASIFVMLFVTMVGATPSVVRAMLMSFVALLALLFGRAYVARQALLVSLFLVALYDPLAILSDVSLHLSFLATAGIIYLVPVFEKNSQWLKKGVGKDILLTTLSAYVATLPYLMHVFGSLSLYAIITNLIVLPFVPGIMLLTFFTLSFSYVSEIVATFFGYVTSLLCDIVILVAKGVTHLPYATLSFSVSAGGMLLLYSILVGVATYLSFHKKNETPLTKNDEILSPVMSY